MLIDWSGSGRVGNILPLAKIDVTPDNFIDAVHFWKFAAPILKYKIKKLLMVKKICLFQIKIELSCLEILNYSSNQSF